MTRQHSAGSATQPDDVDVDVVSGRVVEILQAFGIAHVRISDNRLVGLNRRTPGLGFDELRVGQWVRLLLERRYLRVVHAEVLGR